MTRLFPFTVAAAIVIVGCAKPPAGPPPLTIAAAAGADRAPMTIAANAEINPDVSGRPSPIVVRVYQLRTDEAFNAAEFFALFDDEQKVLGQALISRDEFQVTPMETRTLDVSLAGETRFVGVVAAFRDIRNAQWRAAAAAPRRGVTVSIERARVVLTPAAK
jgi:type VI secretion system protein VasD